MSNFISGASEKSTITEGVQHSLPAKNDDLSIAQIRDIAQIRRVQRRILAAQGWFRIDAEVSDVAKAVLALTDALAQSNMNQDSDAQPASDKVPADKTHMDKTPAQTVLSTSEAADILMVSRPYLVKLLEQGAIAFHKVGTHRRIKSADLYAYMKRIY